MATQATLLSDLFTLKNIAKSLYQSCTQSPNPVLMYLY